MPFLNQIGRRPPRVKRPPTVPQCNCPVPPSAGTSRAASGLVFQTNLFSSGNMNTPGSLATGRRRKASVLNSATWLGNPHPKTVYRNQRVNAFGRAAGAPGGSGRKPANTLLK